MNNTKEITIYDSENENEYSDNWHDLLYQLDKTVENNLFVIGELGLWDGLKIRYSYPQTNNITTVIKMLNMYDRHNIVIDNDNDLIVNAYHHDGHNRYVIREFRSGDIEQKKYDKEFINNSDMYNSTVPIGDRVKKILGYE